MSDQSSLQDTSTRAPWPTPIGLVGSGINPATTHEKAAWVLMGAAILFVFYYQLAPALLAGLMVHALIQGLSARLAGNRLSHGRAKILAIVMVGLGVVGVATAIVLVLVAVVKGRLGDLPSLMQKMAEIVEHARGWVPLNWIPEAAADADQLRASLAEWLRNHAQELQRVGSETLRVLAHALVGIVVGALVSINVKSSDGPLGRALLERVRRFAEAFERVVFAQIKISALNTCFTATYLFLILPLFGVYLPFRGTLVGVTFSVGLLPVVGNLISNSIIFLISLDVSLAVAVASLVYLIVLHKLEYFLNAKIVGSQIRASAWEILLALFVFEAAFGVPGVILAPIVYAYVKNELLDRKLI